MENQELEKNKFNWRHLYYFPYALMMLISYVVGVVLLSFVAFFQYLAQNHYYAENFKREEVFIRGIFKSIFN